MIHLYLSVVPLVVMVTGQQLVPCDNRPSEYLGPPLPTLPDQFHTHIEANIVQKGQTINMKEFYDYPNNRLMMESYMRQTGQRQRIHFNFSEKKGLVVFENQTCIVMPLNSRRHSFSFMTAQNGSHVKSVKDMLYFGKEMGEVYKGSEKVRGIAVDHWSTCVRMADVNGTFTLDYYFSKDENYSIDGANVRVPVRAVINGTAKGRDRQGNVTDTYHTFYHIYEFMDFHAGPIKDSSVFEIPVGTFCNDSLTNKTFPDIPDHFTMSTESVSVGPDGRLNFQARQIFYDNRTNIIRIDGSQSIAKEQRMSEANHRNHPVTTIHDYNTNLVYTIDKWEKNCTVNRGKIAPLPDTPFVLNGFQNNQGFPQHLMMTPRQLLNLGGGNFIYQGKKTLRNIEMESWASLNKSSNDLTEVFFRKEDPGPLPKGANPMVPKRKKRVPAPGRGALTVYTLAGIYTRNLGADGQASGLWSQMNVYGFMSGHPDPDVFDIASCYELGHHYSYMAVKTEGNYENDVEGFQLEFTSAVRSVIASGAKVSPTRVTSILIEQDPSNTNQLRVFFRLLDNQVKDVSMIYSGPSLAKAKTYLQEAVAKGMNFDVQYPTIENNFLVVKGSLWETMSTYTQPTESSIQTYGAGSMAGLGIGMLVIGAILGLLVAFGIYKRIDTSVPYQVTS